MSVKALLPPRPGSPAVAFSNRPCPVATAGPERQWHWRRRAGREGWSDPAPPRASMATRYVGTCGSADPITSDKGHILIDIAPAKAAPSVLANIRRSALTQGRQVPAHQS